jgi:hypothetical protein
MNWIKENWFKLTLVLLVIGAFYWFELRPASIRTECKKYVSDSHLDLTSDAEKTALGLDMNKINKAEQEKSDFWFKDCLNERGLKE